MTESIKRYCDDAVIQLDRRRNFIVTGEESAIEINLIRTVEAFFDGKIKCLFDLGLISHAELDELLENMKFF